MFSAQGKYADAEKEIRTAMANAPQDQKGLSNRDGTTSSSEAEHQQRIVCLQSGVSSGPLERVHLLECSV
jgi:hypothetical protein